MVHAGWAADQWGPIANLSTMKLREFSERLGELAAARGARILDAYTLAHLGESKACIEKALDAQYIFNMPEMGGIANPFAGLFGSEKEK